MSRGSAPSSHKQKRSRPFKNSTVDMSGRMYFAAMASSLRKGFGRLSIKQQLSAVCWLRSIDDLRSPGNEGLTSGSRIHLPGRR